MVTANAEAAMPAQPMIAPLAHPAPAPVESPAYLFYFMVRQFSHFALPG